MHSGSANTCFPISLADAVKLMPMSLLIRRREAILRPEYVHEKRYVTFYSYLVGCYAMLRSWPYPRVNTIDPYHWNPHLAASSTKNATSLCAELQTCRGRGLLCARSMPVLNSMSHCYLCKWATWKPRPIEYSVMRAVAYVSKFSCSTTRVRTSCILLPTSVDPVAHSTAQESKLIQWLQRWRDCGPTAAVAFVRRLELHRSRVAVLSSLHNGPVNLSIVIVSVLGLAEGWSMSSLNWDR